MTITAVQWLGTRKCSLKHVLCPISLFIHYDLSWWRHLVAQMAPPNGKTGPASASTDNSNRFNSFQTQVVVSGRTRQPPGGSPEASSSRWSSAGRQGAAAHGRPADSLRNTIRGAPHGRSADVPLTVYYGLLFGAIRRPSSSTVDRRTSQEASRGSLPATEQRLL